SGTSRAPMEPYEWRCAGRLPGTKDFHGEADSVRALVMTRLSHQEPAALTVDVASPIATHPAVGALESRQARMSRGNGCERHHERRDGNQVQDGGHGSQA